MNEVGMIHCTSRVALVMLGALLIAAGAVAAEPTAVKTGPRNEIRPAGAGEWLVWSESRPGRPGTFDVWAQRGAAEPFRVNASGTQAYSGGIDGTRLVYQQVRPRRSDLRLYELVGRRHLRLPAGINTRLWEWRPTTSGDWLLFGRGRRFTSALQTILLRNLVTGEQRVLDRLRSRRGMLAPGQVNGGFAVWVQCNPNPRCRIRSHNIATRATVTLVPPAAGSVVYGPAVSANGTTYYARNRGGCGNRVELVKHTVDGTTQVLLALPNGDDLQFSYATLLRARPPFELITTRVYYDRRVCRRNSWDAYRVDDAERRPPPLP
jgi:hypothetical protein